MCISNVDNMLNCMADLGKTQQLQGQEEDKVEEKINWDQVEEQAEAEVAWDEVEDEWFEFGTDFLIF